MPSFRREPLQEGANPTRRIPAYGIVEKEAAIHISNLQVLDPKAVNPRRSVKLNAKVN
ncbi:MAG: hypothetical protein ACLU5I_02775 [Alistipes finegoldii]